MDISPAVRSAIADEIEQERQRRSQQQKELQNKRKQLIASAREHLPHIFQRACEGVAVLAVADAEGIATTHLVQAIYDTAKDITDRNLAEWVRSIGRILKRGDTLAAREIIIVADLLARSKEELLTWRGVCSQRYQSSETTLEARAGLAEWLKTAGDVADAVATVDAILEKCRAAMISTPKCCVTLSRSWQPLRGSFSTL